MALTEIFRIPHSQLLVAAKNNEKETAQRLIAHGFSLVDSDELKDFKKYKANKMVIDGQHHSQDEMGLVNVVRSRESIIPDAYAMIVALIVVGIWQHALLTNE